MYSEVCTVYSDVYSVQVDTQDQEEEDRPAAAARVEWCQSVVTMMREEHTPDL